MPILTVGYEGRTIDELRELLSQRGVDVVLDVRILPTSRKPGMSKTAMSRALAEVGIRYVHFKELGTPLPMLKEVRRTGVYDWDAYRTHMLERPVALERAAELCGAGSTGVLLCYEAAVGECHRQVIADYLAERTQQVPEHL